MRKMCFILAISFVITFCWAYMALAVTKVTTTGIETWLCAVVPNTGDAVTEGFVKDWIKENGGVGEAELSDPTNGPEAGDQIGSIDAKYAWREVKGDPASNYVINFERPDLGWGQDNVVAYMYLYITSDKDRKVNIYGGSDDCLKIFVNGNLVHENPALRGWGPNQDVVKDVQLKQGRNGILFKVVEQGGGWAGWGRIEPIDGLKSSTTKKEDGSPIPPPLSISIFFDEFLHLIGPNSKAGAALDAQIEDLIATWSGGKYTETMASLGKGVARGVAVGNEMWTEGKFTNFGGNNLQIVAEEIFNKKGDQNDFTWYGYTIINSPNEREVDLCTGSDDACKLWVNGEVVQDVPKLRGSSGFQEKAKVRLNKGPNTVLFKVCEQGGGAAAFLGFDNETDFAGLIIDSSLTPVSSVGKLPVKWGELKR
ncbi:MAG: hypothetical protein ACUVWN_06605 [bacterium]